MMKKCGIVLLTLWMMLMMALPCFAAADSFTPSVTNNGDGTMTVDFPELCPILFLRIAEGTAKPSVCPLPLILLLVFLIVLCIVVLRTAFRKKKSRSGESRR